METNAIIEKILTRSNEVLQNIPTKFKRRIKKRLRTSLYVRIFKFSFSLDILVAHKFYFIYC
jgi:hypothetical protein